MPKNAIYGAGSLGTVLGAYLSRSGRDVVLINHNKEHVKCLNENGARIKGTIYFTQPVKAITPNEMKGTYDVIILLTKKLHNSEIVSFLESFLAEDGVLVTLQNGIPEPDIAKIIGSNRTMGATVEWGATMEEPGVCTLTSSPDSLSFHVGKMEGVTNAQVEKVVSLLEGMGTVKVEDNFMGARWSKLLINATFSGLGTVMGTTFGGIAESPETKDIALACMKECIDVAHANNIEFEPVQGKDITKLFYYHGKIKKAFARALLPIAMKKHRDIEPSMLQDIRHGKPCEYLAINGVVCEWGRKAGVPTPINDRIVKLIHEIEEGDLDPAMPNASMFTTLVR